jgi:hypothetical protein
MQPVLMMVKIQDNLFIGSLKDHLAREKFFSGGDSVESACQAIERELLELRYAQDVKCRLCAPGAIIATLKSRARGSAIDAELIDENGEDTRIELLVS